MYLSTTLQIHVSLIAHLEHNNLQNTALEISSQKNKETEHIANPMSALFSDLKNFYFSYKNRKQLWFSKTEATEQL